MYCCVSLSTRITICVTGFAKRALAHTSDSVTLIGICNFVHS